MLLGVLLCVGIVIIAAMPFTLQVMVETVMKKKGLAVDLEADTEVVEEDTVEVVMEEEPVEDMVEEELEEDVELEGDVEEEWVEVEEVGYL